MHPPEARKRKDYGLVEEILCKECWESLSVKCKVDGLRPAWVKKFLNTLRQHLDSSSIPLQSQRKMPGLKGMGDRVVTYPNAFRIDFLAKEMGMDRDTLWKYASLFHGYNIDGILEPTIVLGLEGESLAVRIWPADKECEPWPYDVEFASLIVVKAPSEVNMYERFSVVIDVDYLFSRRADLFIGIRSAHANGDDWLAHSESVRAISQGSLSDDLYLTLTEPGVHELAVEIYYQEDEIWHPADRIPLQVNVIAPPSSAQVPGLPWWIYPLSSLGGAVLGAAFDRENRWRGAAGGSAITTIITALADCSLRHRNPGEVKYEPTK